MNELRKLPNSRKWTRSTRTYIKAWRDLARPIEKMFDVRLDTFDPDFQFSNVTEVNQGWLTRSVSLPVWFVCALHAKIVPSKKGSDKEGLIADITKLKKAQHEKAKARKTYLR